MLPHWLRCTYRRVTGREVAVLAEGDRGAGPVLEGLRSLRGKQVTSRPLQWLVTRVATRPEVIRGHFVLLLMLRC